MAFNSSPKFPTPVVSSLTLPPSPVTVLTDIASDAKTEPDMRNLVILSGSSHPALVQRMCHSLNLDQGEVSLVKFSNGETSVTVKDSVREKDVYVIQSGCGNVNDNFIELLIMISACKTASARKVTAVLPLFPYSRQPDVPYTKRGAPLVSGKPGEKGFTFESVPASPRKVGGGISQGPSPALLASKLSRAGHESWRPDEQPRPEANSGYKQWSAQAGTLIASLLTCAGADHIITMDLHDPQFQGFFDIPVDNLYGKPLLQQYITGSIPDYQDAVIVSPDAGGAKRATAIADSLGMAFALIHKERKKPVVGLSSSSSGTSSPRRQAATTMLVGDVAGRVAILIDDLVDTGNTVTRAAKLLKDQGAVKVYAIITHGIFSGDAVDRINASAIDKLITTNTTPQHEHQATLGKKLEVLDVSRVFAEAIRRIHNGESLSMLFDHVGF